MVKEQLAIAANTEAEWEAMMRKWEANDYRYEDCDLDYQTKMRGRMQDVSCLILCQQIDFILKLCCQAAVVTGQCLVVTSDSTHSSFFLDRDISPSAISRGAGRILQDASRF